MLRTRSRLRRGPPSQGGRNLLRLQNLWHSSNSYPRFILAKLGLVQFRIQSSLGQKLLMLALLDDCPFVQNKNDVGTLNRCQPMRDDDARFLLHQPLQGLENKLLRIGIEP